MRNSNFKESLLHAGAGALFYGGVSGFIQYKYSGDVRTIMTTGAIHGGATLITASVNLRLYNFVKQKVHSILDNNHASIVAGRSVSSFYTFALTILLQKIANAEGEIWVASLYASFTYISYIYYEKLFLKGTTIHQDTSEG